MKASERIISEDKDLIKQFGDLGLYLVRKAEREIKVISHQNLIQKTSIKKKFDSKVSDRINELRNKFVESNEIYLNNILSLKLSKSNAYFINLKNYLFKKLTINVKKSLSSKIEKSYEKYLKFLENEILENYKKLGNSKQITIELNERDFRFLDKDSNKKRFLENIPHILRQSNDKFIGGYKLLLNEDLISYDYTIDNNVDDKKAIIEKLFSELISEEIIKNIGEKFKTFIQKQRTKIDEVLTYYDFDKIK